MFTQKAFCWQHQLLGFKGWLKRISTLIEHAVGSRPHRTWEWQASRTCQRQAEGSALYHLMLHADTSAFHDRNPVPKYC
jgi:hypothetical protein